MSLKASRFPSKMDDIAGGLEDAGRSWLGLMSLIMMCLWRSLESLFQFLWSSDDWKLRLCLKFGWNPLSLKASRPLSKRDEIAGAWLGCVLEGPKSLCFNFCEVLMTRSRDLLSRSWVIAWFRVSPWLAGWVAGSGRVGLGPRLGISFGWSIKQKCVQWTLDSSGRLRIIVVLFSPTITQGYCSVEADSVLFCQKE